MRSLRHILTLFFLIIITNNSFGQVKLENEILSGFVKSYFSHNEKDKIYIVLMKVTVSNEFDTQKRPLSSFHYNGPAIFHMGLKLIDAIMYSDFIEKNKTKIAVDSIRNLEGNILYLSENERDMIFKNRGWETFRFRYGERPLVSLSRPGINVKKNRALIYFEYSTDGLAGIGMYVILDKLNGKWLVKESMEVWES
jgi:hypothetical protein